MDEVGDCLLEFLSEIFFEVGDNIRCQHCQEIHNVLLNLDQFFTSTLNQSVFNFLAPQSLKPEQYDLRWIFLNDF